MNKYLHPATINGKKTRPYTAWDGINYRCAHRGAFGKNVDKYLSYNDVEICDEWKDNYDAFYEWAETQENFKAWCTLPRAAVDKDIKDYGNKIYCPEKCLLVPQNVNNLLVNLYGGQCQKENKTYPWVFHDFSCRKKKNYRVFIHDKGYTYHYTPEEAYEAAREIKMQLICEMADKEYSAGTISEECVEALKSVHILTLDEIDKMWWKDHEDELAM